MVAATVLKVAFTVLFAFNVNEHVVAVPVHAPDHPVNVEPAAGVAVRVTVCPGVPFAVQVVPQLMEPVEVTVPDPVPDLVMVTE